MRHRLFYLLPDLASAQRAQDELLLKRIEHKYIHFLSNAGKLPDDMREATIFQKTDVVHGAESGLLLGALLGFAFGMWLVYYPLDTMSAKAAIVVITALGGMLFGGWAASMAAAAIPNSRLKAFYPEIESGKILLIVDVPARRIQEIETVMAERHPETRFKGEDSHIPVFP